MNGNEVFKFAIQIMGKTAKRALAKAGLEPADVDLLVPHQANIRIINSEMCIRDRLQAYRRIIHKNRRRAAVMRAE